MEDNKTGISHFLAFDLGATSGRGILGRLCDGILTVKELTRFPNGMMYLGRHMYWNIYSLYEKLCEGLTAAAAEKVGIRSAGIDAWGVDFVPVARDGSISGLPVAYRDPYTVRASEDYFSGIMSQHELYAATGIQHLAFNSIFQMYAQHREGLYAFGQADKILFIPDALAYMLTGKMVTEYTVASTSQLLDPYARDWNYGLAERSGIRAGLFCPVIPSGTAVAPLDKDIAMRTGVGKLDIVAVAGHDTASAVAAVPAPDGEFAYLSSGTWSLMGIEIGSPMITPATEAFNMTNEGGVCGTVRLLKNITGMWLLEQCLSVWKGQGTEYTYDEMVALAQNAPEFLAFIDPDDAAFASPGNMPAAIAAYCRASGQHVPESHGEIIRIILESLALKYRMVLDEFRSIAPFPVRRLHVVGGGSKNSLLNRFTAGAAGIPVIAGPAEATAIGNLMMQAYAAGNVSSLEEIRQTVCRSVKKETFMPADTGRWNAAYRSFRRIAGK